jgi:hypothetical protein
MKKIALICALAALTACQQDAPEPVAEETVAAEAATPAAYAIEAGTYDYTRSDGVSGVNTLAADGTYSNARTDGVTETGTWGQEGDLGCFTPEEGEKRCYTFTTPDAEGNFTGTMADGVTVEVKKTA